MENRPQGRQKHITGQSSPVQRRGTGQGTGPVGSAGGYHRSSGSGGYGPHRSSGGGGGLIKLIIILAVVLLGGGGGILSFFGSSDTTAPQQSYSGSGSTVIGTLDQSSSGNPAPVSSRGWLGGNNTGKLNSNVAAGARAKYTTLRGDGSDTVTVMVYMCGTDLESKSGMATKDLQEMLGATLSDRVNLIVYTGGCTKWKNNIVSSSVNQIYKVENDGMVCLLDNAGSGAMTSPKTLTSFIQFCRDNYPANRNMLILWDHGGGSVSGYGYDEKNRGSGSMNLKGLNEALSGGGMKFDIIGFDACLMATLETGLTMAPYADYLLASEETEPGLGWYYTDWLTALSRDPAMSSLELGKRIADDFVSTCTRSCPGQKTTLSLVDLAELAATVPEDFQSFSGATLELLKNDGYETVSTARSSVREFAVSSKIDQVDLVHLALKLDTQEARTLAQTILGAVKYNRTSSDMTNAYGLSLYFPYKKLGNVNNAVSTFSAIGMDSSYTDCIRTFASLEASGQAAAGGSTSPLTALSGQSYSGSAVSSDMLGQMLSGLLGGGSLFDRSLDPDATASYLAANRFDTDALQWQLSSVGNVLHLEEAQWAMVQELDLNVFVDDGQGYIDLGLDNTFDFTETGDLIGSYDGTWIAIDGQPVAYYHLDTVTDGDDYTITGRVPVLLNGSRADLILVFTQAEPYGRIVGARTDYRDGETETVAKAMIGLETGDTIDYLCDFYGYDGSFLDSYFLGEQHIVTGSEEISNVYIDASAVATYRLTDIYNNEFWTPVLP